MTPVFLDTAYVYALLNTRDQWHQPAKRWEQWLANNRQSLLTTEYVIFEIADGLANLRFRAQAVAAIDVLLTSPVVEVVPASRELMQQAIQLYGDRQDKEWGLTDCASFIVMQQRSMDQALTCDADFTQAGFRALLLEEPA
jgi:predicted nucleic acid-binding protein